MTDQASSKFAIEPSNPITGVNLQNQNKELSIQEHMFTNQNKSCKANKLQEVRINNTMDPIDIDAIIRKYSQPSSLLTQTYQSSNHNNQLSTHPSPFQFNHSLSDTLLQSTQTHSSFLSHQPYSNTQNLKTNLDPVPPSESQNLSFISYFDQNLHGGHSNSINHQKHNEIKQGTDNKFGSNQLSSLLKNPSLNQDNPSQSHLRYNNYSWQNSSNNYPQNRNPFLPSESIFNASNPFQEPNISTSGNNYFSRITSPKYQQLYKKPEKDNLLSDKQPQIIVPQTELMNVFSSSKEVQSTANYRFSNKNQANNIFKEKKPQLDFNHIHSLKFNQISTPFNSNYPQSNQSTPEYSSPTYTTKQYTSLQPNFQSTQLKSISNSKQHQISKIPNNYRQLNPTISLKPNNEGFIPLQMTKQQMEYEDWDINSVQMKDKHVYDRLQVTCKMKKANQEEFQNAFCGWKKNVIYDISTKDDNKNKSFWGKWC